MSASAITSNDICARVRARLGAMLPAALVSRADHNITLTIFGGCERLARAIKDSVDRHLLQKEFAAVPASGVVDLSVSTYRNVLIDTLRLPGAIVATAEAGTVFKHAPSMDAMRATTPTDSACVWYHLRGKKLVFKNPSTGALNTYATGVTFLASYIPDIGDAQLPLPAELEDQLVDRVAEIVKQLGGLQFLKMDEDAARTAAGSLAAE